MSDEEKRAKDVSDMFGEASDSDEETFKCRPSSKQVHADASGLFGSDSESDDEKPKKLKKMKLKVKKEVEEKKSLKRKSRDESSSPTSRGIEVIDKWIGDEYDSGDEAKATKEDEAFIDNDDDLEDVMNEYGQDRQDFHDERPDEEPVRAEKELDYFDQTLKSLKSGRARTKMALSPQELESITQVLIYSLQKSLILLQELLYRMDKAHADDLIAIEEHRPALEK
ncbi:hypothetical protein THRCLA_21255, partial [Thraustotheca clavata]